MAKKTKGGKGGITPEDNTGGFQKNPQNINRKGRPPKDPITGYLRDVVEKEGGYPIEAKAVKNAVVTEDKKGVPMITIRGEYVEIKNSDKKIAFFLLNIPNNEAIAIQWAIDAKSRNSTVRARSRETLTERLEGKASQPISIQGDFNAPLVIHKTGETLPRNESEIDDGL